MKYILTVVSLGLVVLVQGSLLRAQDFKQTLLAMQKQYEQTDKLHIRMSIEVFDAEGGKEPYYHEMADIKKSGVNYLCKFGSNDMLLNEKCMVMVDKESREIVYSTRSLKAERRTRDIFQVSMDSVLRYYDKPEHIKEENGIVQYILLQKSGPIKKINLFINAATAMLQKMEYEYNDNQHAIIAFEIFDNQPTFSDDIFKEDQYVLVEKGNLKAKGAFANYSVMGAER